MRVLVLNSGSSSVKFELHDLSSRRVLAGGAAERIGEPGSRLVFRREAPGGRVDESAGGCALPDHESALDRIIEQLSNAGAIDGPDTLDAVGHRVVHGGELFHEPTPIDARVLEQIRSLCALAPLHNPANLLGIEVTLARLPEVPQVAVFDTAFHQTLPPRAHRYAVPADWYEAHGVRRYGFHGTSHAHVVRCSARLLEQPVERLDMIVLHLGAGASAAAVARGRCIETSMGLTPLEGLVMGTRSGDLDPAAIFHVARRTGASLDALERDLNARSGLLGLCGDGDVRDVLERERSGDEAARLALDVYVHRIRKYVGAYLAVLGRADAIAFTAGVGENSAEIRKRICHGLDGLGIRLDDRLNEAPGVDARRVHQPNAAIALLVVPTNEELEIAEQTAERVRTG